MMHTTNTLVILHQEEHIIHAASSLHFQTTLERMLTYIEQPSIELKLSVMNIMPLPLLKWRYTNT